MSAVLAPNPFFDGRHAGELGLSFSLNPFEPGTREFADWARGWRAGAADAAAEAVHWHERLARLTAGTPEPITSMDEPGYWEEKDAEFRAGIRSGIQP
jgi:hypothetical protein